MEPSRDPMFQAKPETLHAVLETGGFQANGLDGWIPRGFHGCAGMASPRGTIANPEASDSMLSLWSTPRKHAPPILPAKLTQYHPRRLTNQRPIPNDCTMKWDGDRRWLPAMSQVSHSHDAATEKGKRTYPQGREAKLKPSLPQRTRSTLSKQQTEEKDSKDDNETHHSYNLQKPRYP